MAPLRWGLLGTAHINRLVIPAIAASRKSEVFAVASRDAARARAYAAAWSIPHALGSYDDLLRAPIDILYLSLPNALHAEWVLRAVDAGLHVLCEKPLALTPGDVERIQEAATRRGRIVAEGFMYRHHAQADRIADVLARGGLGAVRIITGGFTYVRDREPDVRLDASLGGGALWDIGCYPVSFGHWIADAAPTHVVATRQVGPTGVDESFSGGVTYANGVALQFHAGFHAAYDTALRVIGSEGILEVARPYRPDPDDVLLLRRGGHVERIDVGGNAPFVDEVADMEHAVLGTAPPRITLDESRVVAATLAALHTAARERRTIDVDI